MKEKTLRVDRTVAEWKMALCAPPQAENPARQDSLFFHRKLRPYERKNAPRGSHGGGVEEDAVRPAAGGESCKAGFFVFMTRENWRGLFSLVYHKLLMENGRNVFPLGSYQV